MFHASWAGTLDHPWMIWRVHWSVRTVFDRSRCVFPWNMQNASSIPWGFLFQMIIASWSWAVWYVDDFVIWSLRSVWLFKQFINAMFCWHLLISKDCCWKTWMIIEVNYWTFTFHLQVICIVISGVLKDVIHLKYHLKIFNCSQLFLIHPWDKKIERAHISLRHMGLLQNCNTKTVLFICLSIS